MLKRALHPLPRLSFLRCLLLILGMLGLISADVAEATDYIRYIDAKITDAYPASATPDCSNYSPSDGKCGGGSAMAHRSLLDVNAILRTMSSTDKAVIYFKRGNTWVFSSDDDRIRIDRRNVTIDAFGTGNKPILDGGGKYPARVTSANIPSMYAIEVGEEASASNIFIRNLRIQNMYPGGGIIFKGAAIGKYFEGPGSVEDCEINTVGWSAIEIYRVQNNRGSSGAIKIEHNEIYKSNEYCRNNLWKTMWPQGIQSNDKISYGHECRYNKVSNIYGEGIGATGFSVVEYNIVSNTKAPSIYIGTGNSSSGAPYSSIVRYNLVWGNRSGNYSGSDEIRLDDESVKGVNTETTIEIYGNIVVGGFAGIDLRNNPYDGSSWSKWGTVKVYNNTLIDNKYNILTSYSDRFSNVEIKNNALIISADAETSCTHITNWQEGGWNGWIWGPNSFSGGKLPSSTFYKASVDNSGDSKLPKTSGWRNLTSTADFTFNDFYPQVSSKLVDNPKAIALNPNGYQQSFLTKGTQFDIMKTVLANQTGKGPYWDFGAVVFDNTNQVPSLDPPTGLSLP